MKGRYLFGLFLVLALSSIYLMGSKAIELPYYIFRSLLRMIIAYALSLIFSLSLGILIAHNKRIFNIIFPILDILQSVPVLGFVPLAILLFIQIAPDLGVEAVSIFLIFTSMTWSIIFNVIEGVRTIPKDILETAKLLKLKGFDYLFHIVLPSIFAPVVSGSITGWGGSWYFLVVAELFSFGKKMYPLPGLGYFIAESAYSGSISLSLLGIGILGFVVLTINKYIWRVLLIQANRYVPGKKFEYEEEEWNEVIGWLEEIYLKIREKITEMMRKKKDILAIIGILPENVKDYEEKVNMKFFFIVGFLFLTLIYLIHIHPRISGTDLLNHAIHTIGKIFIAYVIVVFWTGIFGIWAGNNPKALKIVMPLLDFAQSIPAVAFFPIFVVIIISLLGGEVGTLVASVLLIMTGMQWYLLFNIIRAVRQIPMEVRELMDIFKLSVLDRYKHLFFPAIIPALVAGSIEAIGGGLNATIVSEYIIYKGQIFSTPGLGYLMTYSTAIGDNIGILISVISMMLLVFTTNKLVWRPLINNVEKYKFGE